MFSAVFVAVPVSYCFTLLPVSAFLSLLIDVFLFLLRLLAFVIGRYVHFECLYVCSIGIYRKCQPDPNLKCNFTNKNCKQKKQNNNETHETLHGCLSSVYVCVCVLGMS